MKEIDNPSTRPHGGYPDGNTVPVVDPPQTAPQDVPASESELPEGWSVFVDADGHPAAVGHGCDVSVMFTDVRIERSGANVGANIRVPKVVLRAVLGAPAPDPRTQATVDAMRANYNAVIGCWEEDKAKLGELERRIEQAVGLLDVLRTDVDVSALAHRDAALLDRKIAAVLAALRDGGGT